LSLNTQVMTGKIKRLNHNVRFICDCTDITMQELGYKLEMSAL